MCYWVGTKKVRQEMLRRLEQDPEDEISQLYYKYITAEATPFPLQEHFVAIGKAKPQLTAIIKKNESLQLQNMQWTMPYEYTDSKSQKQVKRELLNSSCERIFFQHKDSIFNQRCLIAIDGYYEFFHYKKEKYPYYIYPANDGVFYAGGIWKSITDESTGEIKETLSIITTPANNLTRKLHNNPDAPNGPRMLLLIPEKLAIDFLDAGLNSNHIKEFFKPFDENNMKAHTVIQFLRKENLEFINTPNVQELYEYEELLN